MQIPSPPPMDVHALSRLLKILFSVMVLSVMLYGVAIAEVAPHIQSRPPGAMQTGLRAMAAVAGLAALYVRFSKINALLSPDVPTDTPVRLTKLRQYYTVCYVLSECTALFGVALRYQGASAREVVPFFIGALVLFGLSYPRMPQDL